MQAKQTKNPPRQSEPEAAVPPKKRNPFLHGLLIGLSVLAVAALLVIAYLLLLVGEPEEEHKNAAPVQESRIQTPMAPIEMLGGGGLQELPLTFGEPVLFLNGGTAPEKIRVNDTAYGGSYIRIATLHYTLPDGSGIELLSLRPTTAAGYLSRDGYSLCGDKLYALAGMNAVRMDKGADCILFAQSEKAIYAVRFTLPQLEQVEELLQDTALLQGSTEEVPSR